MKSMTQFAKDSLFKELKEKGFKAIHETVECSEFEYNGTRVVFFDYYEFTPFITLYINGEHIGILVPLYYCWKYCPHLHMNNSLKNRLGDFSQRKTLDIDKCCDFIISIVDLF